MEGEVTLYDIGLGEKRKFLIFAVAMVMSRGTGLEEGA